MEMKNLVKGLTAAGLIAFAGNSFAVTADGNLDTTSTGTVDISVDVGDLVQISGLVAMTGLTNTFGSATTASTPACVYRNGSADYDVQMTSDNGAGTDFFLTDGTDFVVYDVTFDDGVVVTPTDMDHGAAAVNFTGADTSSTSCAVGGNNATIAISIPETHATLNGWSEVPAATYIDELSITVAPR